MKPVISDVLLNAIQEAAIIRLNMEKGDGPWLYAKELLERCPQLATIRYENLLEFERAVSLVRMAAMEANMLTTSKWFESRLRHQRSR